MKRIVLVCALFCCIQILFSQSTPTPTQSPQITPVTYIASAKYIKRSLYDYTIYNENGSELKDIVELGFLKTETLSVLHKPSRTIILLDDFKTEEEHVPHIAHILERDVSKDFYITNPNSYKTYVNDKVYTPEVTNINGNYLAFIRELNETYLEKDIRKFADWGTKNLINLGLAPEHTYWYKNTEKDSYGIIKEGNPIDYSLASIEYRGNDLIVDYDGKPKYILENYKNASDFDIKPVKINLEVKPVIATGCVKGDCYNGWGKWQFENAYYEGFWESGKRQGYGLYKWNDSGKYIGIWYNDNMSGYGSYIADNKDNIVGEYKNGNLNGLGITLTSNVWEQGIFTNGNIITKYDFISNKVEIGCTAGDCQNKYGRYKWANGDSYTGFFKNGNFYMGTYTFANGNKYSGEYNSNNQYHGSGRFFFKEGNYYGGDWKDGKYDGKGYYHDKDLVQQIGEWSKGVLVKSYKN